jgi:hypothetical protein
MERGHDMHTVPTLTYNIDGNDLLRMVTFRPYRKGMGPTFTLVTWDTYTEDAMGKSVIGYRLTKSAGVATPERGARHEVIFEGTDFAVGRFTCIDSDEALASLMGFLTLRPGDTDDEYFAGYTKEQLAYAEAHAEALSCEVYSRFGED